MTEKLLELFLETVRVLGKSEKMNHPVILTPELFLEYKRNRKLNTGEILKSEFMHYNSERYYSFPTSAHEVNKLNALGPLVSDMESYLLGGHDHPETSKPHDVGIYFGTRKIETLTGLVNFRNNMYRDAGHEFTMDIPKNVNFDELQNIMWVARNLSPIYCAKTPGTLDSAPIPAIDMANFMNMYLGVVIGPVATKNLQSLCKMYNMNYSDDKFVLINEEELGEKKRNSMPAKDPKYQIDRAPSTKTLKTVQKVVVNPNSSDAAKALSDVLGV